MARYIDADKLREKINPWLDGCVLVMAVEALDEAPTADVVPKSEVEALKNLNEHLYEQGYRKQSEGEWKKRGNEKTCSLCKFIYYSNNDDWNYCPNCGAHMRGGTK